MKGTGTHGRDYGLLSGDDRNVHFSPTFKWIVCVWICSCELSACLNIALFWIVLLLFSGLELYFQSQRRILCCSTAAHRHQHSLIAVPQRQSHLFPKQTALCLLHLVCLNLTILWTCDEKHENRKYLSFMFWEEAEWSSHQPCPSPSRLWTLRPRQATCCVSRHPIVT